MKDSNMDYGYSEMQPMSDGTKQILTGILIGGLVGATAMMLFAPRSGEDLRSEIRDKAADLRDRTTETVKDRVSDVVSKASDLASDLKGSTKGKTQDIKEMGQDALVEQLDRAQDALAAIKKAIKSL